MEVIILSTHINVADRFDCCSKSVWMTLTAFHSLWAFFFILDVNCFRVFKFSAWLLSTCLWFQFSTRRKCKTAWMSRRGGARKPRSDEGRLSDQEYILKRKRNNDAVNRFIFSEFGHFFFVVKKLVFVFRFFCRHCRSPRNEKNEPS